MPHKLGKIKEIGWKENLALLLLCTVLICRITCNFKPVCCRSELYLEVAFKGEEIAPLRDISQGLVYVQIPVAKDQKQFLLLRTVSRHLPLADKMPAFCSGQCQNRFVALHESMWHNCGETTLTPLICEYIALHNKSE